MNSFYDILTKPQPEPVEQDREFDREEYKTRKQAERKELYDAIDATLDAMTKDPAAIVSYLDVQARFDRYSVSNALLITVQMPEATGPFKTFDDWKDGKVSINKGETAISLLEPGPEVEREDGSKATSYHVKKVFDRSQTNAPPREEREFSDYDLLEGLIHNAPCELKVSDNIPETYNAVYNPQERALYVRPGLDEQEIFRAVSLQLCHAYLNKNGNYRKEENANTVFCAAYMLCKRYGVDTQGSFEFPAVPDEYREMTPQGLKAELTRVRSLAGEISRNISQVLENRQPVQQHREEAR